MTEIVDAQRISEIPGFPMARTCPFAPPPEYAELRESTPTSMVQLTLNGRKAWLLTKYEDVVQVLVDPRASSDITLDGYPMFMPVPVEMFKAGPRSLFFMDPPQHTVQRRLLIPEFTVRRIQASRERTQEITDELIDRMLAAGRPVDLVEKLAMPLPSYAMCELIGIPRSDRDFLHHWIGRLVGKDTTPEQHGELQMQMGVYMDKLLGEKEQKPGDDLVSRLIARNVEQEAGLSRLELAVLIQVVIAGGHETTANMIALGVLALLRNPDQLAKLKADPSLAPKAVEELLRLFSVSDFGTSRVALEDIEVGGVTIRAGEGIIASMAAANHDPAVFAEPGRLDIERTPNKHVAFGHGMHQCSGQGLVRMQLEIVFNTLFRRLPDLRLAVDFDELQYKDHSLIHGLAGLPVTW